MIEHEFKSFRVAGLQRIQSKTLRLRFEAAAAERAVNTAVSVENCLRTQFLRTGAFHTRNDAERDRFAATRGIGQDVKNRSAHAERLIRSGMNSKSETKVPQAFSAMLRLHEAIPNRRHIY